MVRASIRLALSGSWKGMLATAAATSSGCRESVGGLVCDKALGSNFQHSMGSPPKSG
jgi:hypothetical protein